MPRSTGNCRFLIVATDYFNKWVEAKPLAHIRESDARKFVWKNIITRFGIPQALVTDNGKQFEGKDSEAYVNSIVSGIIFQLPSIHNVMAKQKAPIKPCSTA